MLFQIMIDQRLTERKKRIKQTNKQHANFLKVVTFSRKNQYSFKVEREEAKFQ